MINRRARDRKRRAIDALVSQLLSAGVRHVFGVPGGTIGAFNDALLDCPEMKCFTTRNEAEAVFAACGMALQGGPPGVVFTTSGPGATNAFTGIASAFCDGIPLVVLIGEVPRNLQGKGILQDGSAHSLNIAGMLRSITKDCWEANSASALPILVQRALALATSGRPGPVVITLPHDIQIQEIFAPEVAVQVASRFDISDVSLARAIECLRLAKRPVILAGSGARRSARELRAFAENAHIPVITTPKGKGVFPENHPLSLGVFGIGGHPSAAKFFKEGTDLVLALGTSLGDVATEGFNPALYPNRTLIQVDVDGSVLGRHYPVDIGFVAPIADVLPKLHGFSIGRSGHHGITRHSNAETDGSRPDTIAPSRALWELQQILPRDTQYTIDSGEHFLFASHYLEIEHPDSFWALTGLGSMGTSIGLAMGVQLAHPDRRVAVIIGDGGFTMVGTELIDLAALTLPVVVCIINDGRLGMCDIGHEMVYKRKADFSLPPFDAVEMCKAMGCNAARVKNPGELLALKDEILASKVPFVIDIIVDTNFKLPKRDRIGAMGGGSKTTK